MNCCQSSATAEFSGRQLHACPFRRPKAVLPTSQCFLQRYMNMEATQKRYDQTATLQKCANPCGRRMVGFLHSRSMGAVGGASDPAVYASVNITSNVAGPSSDAAPSPTAPYVVTDPPGPSAQVGLGDEDRVISPSSSYSLNELVDTSASSLDGEEMCALVADPESGEVQVVCESDPTHPLSLTERAVLNPLLSPTLMQDIEAKLEADLTTIAVTILFAVGFVSLEFGVNDLIEHYFGDSLLSDVVCVLVGLVVVFWVRLSKVRLMRFDRWR